MQREARMLHSAGLVTVETAEVTVCEVSTEVLSGGGSSVQQADCRGEEAVLVV